MLGDPELRTYVTLWACASILLTAALVLDHRTDSIFELLRQGAFQAAAVLSTTGYHSADFDTWPDFSRALLFLLMFVGASTASTGGSIKVVRVLIVAKKLIVDLKRLPRPRAVFPVRIGRRAIRDEVVTSVVTYFILTVLVFTGGGLLLAVMGLDSVTAFGASATCLANVGPGFGNAGPADGYADLPVRAKLVLMVLMLLGRLELVPIMGLLAVWRR